MTLQRAGTLFLLGSLLTACSIHPTSSGEASPGNISLKQQVRDIQKGDVVRAVLTGKDARILDLLNAGADINESVGNGSDRVTPLFAAIVTKNKSAAALLIRNGAALDPTYKGYSAEDLALYFDDNETATLIRQYRKLQKQENPS